MQSIMIGDDIEVFITEIKGDKVRLGVAAPSHVSIHRREVYDKIQRQMENGVPSNVTASPVTTELFSDLVTER
jgi:carbon storage regulator